MFLVFFFNSYVTFFLFVACDVLVQRRPTSVQKYSSLGYSSLNPGESKSEYIRVKISRVYVL